MPNATSTNPAELGAHVLGIAFGYVNSQIILNSAEPPLNLLLSSTTRGLRRPIKFGKLLETKQPASALSSFAEITGYGPNS